MIFFQTAEVESLKNQINQLQMQLPETGIPEMRPKSEDVSNRYQVKKLVIYRKEIGFYKHKHFMLVGVKIISKITYCSY